MQSKGFQPAGFQLPRQLNQGAIMSEQNNSPNAKNSFSQTVQVIFSTTWKQTPLLVAGLFTLSIFSAVINLANPRIFQEIIDALIQGNASSHLIFTLVVLGAILMIAKGVFHELTYRINDRIAKQTDRHWRIKGLHQFYRLPFSWHDQHDSGEVASKMTRGGEAITAIIMDIFGSEFIIAIFSLILAVIYVAITFPTYLPWLLLPVPFYIVITWHFSNQIAKAQAASNELYHIANKAWHDGASNSRYVKAYGQESFEVDFYHQRFQKAEDSNYEIQKKWFFRGITQTIFQTLIRGFLIWVAGNAVLNHQLTIGEFTLLLSYQQLVIAPTEQISKIFTRIRRVATRASELMYITNENDPLTDHEKAVFLPKLRNHITLNNVHFKYNESKTILSGINVTIPKGKVTAMVGKSGAGKSTIAALLLRFHDPTIGEVYWDDHDVKYATRESLRQRIIPVLQDTSLFNRSIRDNIAYGFPKATMKQIQQAAKLAHAHEFITQLANGYDSIVGERGVKLSGGQRQRIILARAILSKADVLLLDEATSHLDSETENAIRESIQFLKGKKTQIIIAHRLSTVKQADQIIVLENGKISAVGKHSELIRKSPLYRNLCQLQFSEPK